MLAKLVVIEGADKCGKATHSKMLAHALRRYGDRVTRVEVPYNDRLTHKIIYKMLRSGFAKKHPNVFQFAQFVNKFLFQLVVLPFLSLTNDVVVFDRWSLSAVVYGDATGANKIFSRIMYGLLAEPDLTIILTGTSHKRNTVDDDYEKDSALQREVNKGYLTCAAYAWEGGSVSEFVLVNNDGTVDEVHERVMRAISNRCQVCGVADCDCGARL